MRYTYIRAKKSLELIANDISILAGDTMGASDTSWRDVAGTAAVNLRQLALLLDNARAGDSEPFLVFPSLAGLLDTM